MSKVKVGTSPPPAIPSHPGTLTIHIPNHKYLEWRLSTCPEPGEGSAQQDLFAIGQDELAWVIGCGTSPTKEAGQAWAGPRRSPAQECGTGWDRFCSM